MTFKICLESVKIYHNLATVPYLKETDLESERGQSNQFIGNIGIVYTGLPRYFTNKIP